MTLPGREAGAGKPADRPGRSGGDVLLTGATGFVGMEVMARYLERSRRQIVALVRAPDDQAAGARIDGVLDNLFGARAAEHRPRVEARAAELTSPSLGLCPAVRERLAARVSTLVHGADELSRAICEKFVALPQYAAARTVMFYVDVRTEVRTRDYLRNIETAQPCKAVR